MSEVDRVGGGGDLIDKEHEVGFGGGSCGEMKGVLMMLRAAQFWTR